MILNKAKKDRTIDTPVVESASQWHLMWLKFKDHKLAMAGLAVLAVFYTQALLAPFLSPYDPWQDSSYIYAPPTRIHVLHEGKLMRPFIYRITPRNDPATFDRTF